jgi:hypothetical protein
MLQTRRGTEDGFSVRQYQEGEVYEVREHLARMFLAAGYAIREEADNYS